MFISYGSIFDTSLSLSATNSHNLASFGNILADSLLPLCKRHMYIIRKWMLAPFWLTTLAEVGLEVTHQGSVAKLQYSLHDNKYGLTDTVESC